MSARGERTARTTSPASEVWQARISTQLARELQADAEVLGLDGRSDIVRAALDMLHRRAVEVRMAREISDYYGGDPAPPPLSVVSHRRQSGSDE